MDNILHPNLQIMLDIQKAITKTISTLREHQQLLLRNAKQCKRGMSFSPDYDEYLEIENNHIPRLEAEW